MSSVVYYVLVALLIVSLVLALIVIKLLCDLESIQRERYSAIFNTTGPYVTSLPTQISGRTGDNTNTCMTRDIMNSLEDGEISSSNEEVTVVIRETSL